MFNIIPINELSKNPDFYNNFLKNSDYAETLQRIYALQNISIFLKNPQNQKNEELIITRPKSSSLRSPIKSNSHSLIANHEIKSKYQNSPANFPIPGFSPQIHSPSPPSHNSLASPKLSYEGFEHNNMNAVGEGDSPISPSNFAVEMQPYEDMKGNILNIAKSQNGSRFLLFISFFIIFNFFKFSK